MSIKKITFLLVLITYIAPISAQEMDKMWGDKKNKTENSNISRGKLFREGRYAMFIHWGVYSQLGGRWQGKTYYGICEWLKLTAKISYEDYLPLPKDFNPSSFDAKAIAQLARDAGMKYIIITSKHHDGFAMYHSKVDNFNIVDATPFKRDPMKELAEACKEYGLGFGFYYSHNQDWMYPGGNGGPRVNAKGDTVDFDYYF